MRNAGAALFWVWIGNCRDGRGVGRVELVLVLVLVDLGRLRVKRVALFLQG